MEKEISKIKIGISSCLVGEEVRFDTGHKRNSFIMNILAPHFEFMPFCPEMAIGMGTPRETIRLVEDGDQIRCVGTKTATLDVTDKLNQCAEDQAHWHKDLCGYILKKIHQAAVWNGFGFIKDMPERKGVGLYAAKLMKNFPHLPVEEEGRLGDAVLRENFIQRVFIYARWKNLVANDFNWKTLTAFHANHKFIFVSHNQHMAKELGNWLAQNNQTPAEELANTYLEMMMALLKEKANRKSHTNTLTHIQGFLKNDIDKHDKQELVEVIDQYRLGLLPLIVPITLLRHHFRRHPNPYIEDTYYLKPHPSEMMLLNNL